jgi:glycosyltransferase involved in cell wall biosynthesis
MSEPPVGVCHVITQLELGGAQDNTLHTVASLRPPFQGRLVAGPGGMLDGEAARLRHVPLTFIDQLVRPIRPDLDCSAVRRLTALFRATRPTIVHTHSSKAGIVGRLAARLAGVPIRVHSIHGFGFNAWQPAALRHALIAMERMVAPLTTHFIAVSRATARQGIELGIVPPDRVTVIRSGIRIAEFERAARDQALRNGRGLRGDLGLPADAPLVGMVACFKPQKAPLDFVEVAARVAAQVPGATFVLVGDGELRRAIVARAAALGLGPRLRLLGWRRDVARVMSALDVLLHTSLWEGLPRVLPEAIAAGLPVVATGVDGATDILEDGVSGIVCRPHDIGALAAGVQRLLADRDLRRSLAARARRLLPEFDIDAMVRSQEELYARLLRDAAL